MSTRQDLADALSTVDGVTGYVRPPSVLKIGAAWPLIGSMPRGPGDSFAVVWRVQVFLGGDEWAAQEFMDSKLPAITAALDPIAHVDIAFPAVLTVNKVDTFVVEIQARAEFP